MSASTSRRKARSGSSARSGAKPASKRSQNGSQAGARLECPDPGCERTYANERTLARHVAQAHPPAPSLKGLNESPVEAVERVLADMEITSRRAVLAATVRTLALALMTCEPTDVAKTSKELDARMRDLLELARPADDDADWTESDE